MAVAGTNIFKFRVSFTISIRFRVKLYYINLDLVRLKALLTRLTLGVLSDHCPWRAHSHLRIPLHTFQETHLVL